MSRGITIDTQFKITDTEIRHWFENQSPFFYGNNSLQRDGEGYDSSYVDSLWYDTKDFFNGLMRDIECQEVNQTKKDLYQTILITLLTRN